MKLFVGSLPFATDDSALEALFAEHGAVTSAKVITDRETGRSRGFGFVEMSNSEEATNAMNALNGSEVEGRTIVVNEAHEKGARR